MKEILALLFCCFFSFSSMNSEESAVSTEFFAESHVSIDEPEQYSVQMHNLQSLANTNDESIVYYYRIKEIDIENRAVFLEDDSKWDIGWWYKDVIMDWQAGDRLSISCSLGWNGVGIQNLDKNSLAWASIWRWNFPSAENTDSIVEVTYGDSCVILTLKSGFQFSLPTFRFFNLTFEVGEGIFVFQNEDFFLIKKLSCGCTKVATLVTVGNPDWRQEAQQ